MNIGIVGSRKRTDKENITKYVEQLPAGVVVVSGGCRGVDSWAVEAARQRGLQTVEFLPDTAHCQQRFEYTQAFYARNAQIAAACDKLVAFVDPSRKGGTENTINHAKKLGKEIVIL